MGQPVERVRIERARLRDQSHVAAIKEIKQALTIVAAIPDKPIDFRITLSPTGIDIRAYRFCYWGKEFVPWEVIEVEGFKALSRAVKAARDNLMKELSRVAFYDPDKYRHLKHSSRLNGKPVP